MPAENQSESSLKEGLVWKDICSGTEPI